MQRIVLLSRPHTAYGVGSCNFARYNTPLIAQLRTIDSVSNAILKAHPIESNAVY